MYAQGLPDIEAYIEQKIPTEPVTAELLVAIPRTPRAQVPSVEGEENDSISSIYKEVREAAANSKTGSKPGGGRKPGGPGKPGAPRSSAAPRHGDKPRTAHPNDGKPRPPRTPRPPRDESAKNIAASTVITAEIPVVTPAPVAIGVSKESFLQRLAKRVKFWGKD
jgi:ATP-dependent RNA helicase RhlB